MTNTARSACPTCPWRRTTPKGGFPGGVLDVVQLRDAIRGSAPAMQCHCSSDDDPLVCVGFALRVGRASPMFRVAEALGLVDTIDQDPRELLGLPQLLERHAGVCESRTQEEALRALTEIFRVARSLDQLEE